MTKEINYESILAKKKKYSSDSYDNITSNDIIMYSVFLALNDVPEINCLNNAICKNINLAFCVNMPAESYYPVVACDTTDSIQLLSTETKRIINAVRNGQMDEINFKQPTFTICNLGAAGINSFFILPPTETCCLSFTSPVAKPIVTDDNDVAVSKLLKFCISSNQKIINSTVCAAFLNRLDEIINKY